jgi:hypothetical protein
MFENARCPNRQARLLGAATYCANCGYGTKDGKPRRGPFSWKLIVAITLLVPLAICGGCLVHGVNIDFPKDNALPIAFWLEVMSIGLGNLMILVNLILISKRNLK